ncbi:MAG: hypothetical protein KBT06_08120 [Prevotellaceae bacterium]|nr:hypothetical protein [Candidatus Colivivens equi]
MAQFRDFYFTFMTDEEFNVIEGTIEDFLDWTFDTDEDDEPFTKEEKLELLDDLIADIEAYKQKI